VDLTEIYGLDQRREGEPADVLGWLLGWEWIEAIRRRINMRNNK